MSPSGQGGLSPIDPDAGVPGPPDWQVIPTPATPLATWRCFGRETVPSSRATPS